MLSRIQFSVGQHRVVHILAILVLLCGLHALASEDLAPLPRPHPELTPQAGPAFAPLSGGNTVPGDEQTSLGPESRGQNFTDLPTPEISVGLLIGTVPAHDTGAFVVGNSSSEVALLTMDSYALKAAYSSDNGATFGAEVVVAGPDPPVVGWRATLAGDGKLYLAYRFGDPDGDVGLRFQRSDDMGRTWTTPATLVERGDATHGVAWVDWLAANGSGCVAVVYHEWWEGSHVYVVTSTDGGANWNGPVRVDAGDTSNQGISGAAVAVGSNGWVHAAFAQTRASGAQVWYARSKDGGVTFEAEKNLDSLLPGRTGSGPPDIEVGNDGSVLISFWDKYGNDYIYVLRSTNAGDSFSRTYSGVLNASDSSVTPRLWVASGTNTLLLGWVNSAGALQVVRSGDNGATFGSVVNLVTANANVHYAVRTSGTNWAVAWEDRRNAGIISQFTDVYVRVSTTDGVNYGAEQRADRDAAGASESRLASVAACGADNLFVCYIDRRPSLNGYNVWANRSPANPLNLALNERRVDADTGTDNVLQYYWPAVATDGADHVYVAHAAAPMGPWTDMYVAASGDRGRTFSQTRRVSTSAPGSALHGFPIISAHSDGTVYAAYYRQAGPSSVDLVVNRSRDFGQTWLATEKLVATLSNFYDFDLESLPGGKVYIAYTSNGTTVYLVRSSDYFDTFTSTDVDQNSTGYNGTPKICAQGDQVVLVWESANVAVTYWSVWGTVSTDGGGTWSSRVQLRPEGAANGAVNPDLACDGTNAGVAVWRDLRSGGSQIYSNRYNGSSWMGDVNVSPQSALGPRATFQSGTTGVAVTYGDGFSVWVSRSTDGGASWLADQRLDDAAPQPLARSAAPVAVSDRTGNLWIVWYDSSAGHGAIAVRRSGDEGASFEPVYRVDRDEPQGAKRDSLEWYQFEPAAVAPGIAFFVFTGERSSPYWDNRVNAYEPSDMDRDGATVGADCNDFDARAWATPLEVSGVEVSQQPGATRVEWDSQAISAGPGTAYDIVTGYVSSLLSGGSYSSASCLVPAWGAPPYDDARSGPPAQDSFYYLVRAGNSCARATYGDSTLVPDPRDVLEQSTPCP